MFEIIGPPVSTTETEIGRIAIYRVASDGIVIEDVYAEKSIERNTIILVSQTPKSAAHLATYESQALLSFANRAIIFERWSDLDTNKVSLRIEISHRPSFGQHELHMLSNRSMNYVKFSVEPNQEEWIKTINFGDYVEDFRHILKKFSKGNSFSDEYSTESYSDNCLEFCVPATFHSENIYDFIEQHVDAIKECHKEVISRIFGFELMASFDFPEELRSAGMQYLYYFGRFLSDLGINATPDLREEAGKVLFAITPNDGPKALEKIQEALAVYLHLPAIPVVLDDSFASVRLKQQIENLKHSQQMAAREIQLAEKVIESQDKILAEKDGVIIYKDLVIEQQNEIIRKMTSPTILTDSLENKEELEEIFEGLKIGKSKFLKEQFGVHLNPITVIKTIGKKILGKEERSITNLDENDQEK